MRMNEIAANLLLADFPEAFWTWGAKGAGAILGSVVSLAYVLPRGRREAAVRFLTGVLIGVTFGSVAGAKIVQHLGLQDAVSPIETVLMGSTAASLSAWWALGFFRRLLERGDKPRAAD